MNRITVLRKLGVLAVASAAALSVSAATISNLASRADLIVVGSTGPTRTETPNGVSFDLAVDRVLKGLPTLGSLHIDHAWKRSGVIFSPNPTEVAGSFRGVWFLKQTTSATWEVLAVDGPDGRLSSLFLPAAATLPVFYHYTSASSDTDKVVIEMAAGVMETGNNPELLLQSSGSLNNQVVHTILSDFLQSEKASFQAVALSVLLAGNDPEAVSKLRQVWPFIREDTSRSYVIRAIQASFRDKTPDSVRQLAAIADEPSVDADLRRAAVSALSSIHTRETLPFLATLLTSEDFEERISGVIGISAFANGCPTQTPANFASLEYIQFKDPSPYRTPQTIAAFAFGPIDSDRESELVSFWLNWWNKNKYSLIN